MLVTNKETSEVLTDKVRSLSDLPDVLALNKQGNPIGWYDYEEYVKQKSKDNILYSLGSYEITLHGGTNARTGERSKLTIDSIVAVDNDINPFSFRTHDPALSKTALYERDRGICSYCLLKLPERYATIDHIVPTSRGGQNTWMNCTLSCKPCNARKDNLLLSETDMELKFLPYVPSFYESLILGNKKILADQMEFLLALVPEHSRLRLN
jgi:5-methylcytosine-specific restriction endonuclease McrA